MEQCVLIEDTSIDHMITATASQALAKEIEDNMDSMTHQIKEKDNEIVSLKMELQQSRRNITTHMINTVPFDNFLRYAWVVENDLNLVQLELYSKVKTFLISLKKFKHMCRKKRITK